VEGVEAEIAEESKSTTIDVPATGN
jgi:hypothetical protein